MMIVQKHKNAHVKRTFSTYRTSLFRPFQRLTIDQIVSMSQRSLRTAPKNRFWALLGPLGASWADL